MKTTVSCRDFIQAFRSAGRADQFSLTGLIALFDYLEELEADIGEEFELDVIALCCDYTEYSSVLECAIENGFVADEGEEEEAALEWLQDRARVIEHADGVIVSNF